MSEVRMSLKEAGDLLGLKPNSVRSRYKKGTLRGEADNMGKLWVWVDPTKVANDRGSKKASSKVTIEGFEDNEIKALKDHLKATTEQLDKANAEIADLKPQAMEAVRLQAEVKGLLDQQGRGEAEIARLVASLGKMDTERRELIEAVLKRRPSLWERITGRGQ
jgi:flagellar motility protein MotE (MotC chaperone)